MTHHIESGRCCPDGPGDCEYSCNACNEPERYDDHACAVQNTPTESARPGGERVPLGRPGHCMKCTFGDPCKTVEREA